MMGNTENEAQSDSTIRAVLKPFWILGLSWALPMTIADFYVNSTETSSKVKAAALLFIAVLILAITPNLQDSYGHAGVAVLIGGVFSILLEVGSKFQGRSIPGRVVINTYASLIICLLIYLMITQFDLLQYVGLPIFGGGPVYVAAALASAILTFVIWILKSVITTRTSVSLNDMVHGGGVIVLCAIFTYAVSQHVVGGVMALFGWAV